MLLNRKLRTLQKQAVYVTTWQAVDTLQGSGLWYYLVICLGYHKVSRGHFECKLCILLFDKRRKLRK